MHPMIASLLRPEAYHHSVGAIQLIETHISWVLLTGPFAYKIKKPVDLGFVDFTTLDKRHTCCEEEVRLNRRLAAALYLGVVPVHGPVESARFSGEGPVIEWAVRMRQFPQDALLAQALADGRLTDRHWLDFADALAGFHHSAGRSRGGFGTAESICAQALANFQPLSDVPGLEAESSALRDWTDAWGVRLTPVFQRRLSEGWIREGHGDLHLGNMILLEDRITAFDCLEFNAELRWIDVVSELAFLHMDLSDHDRPLEATRVLNRWLDRTGDYLGLTLWRWYVVYRAMVRAKVSAMRVCQTNDAPAESQRHAGEAHQYLRFARSAIERPAGRLIVMHGLSGTGKSHVARHLAHALGWIHLRSDVERKRLFGLWGPGAPEAEPRPPGLYAEETTERLFATILPAQAEAALLAGFTVVVDATFLRRRHRAGMRALATRIGSPFVILHCLTREVVAHERLARRAAMGGDPSDADAAVYQAQTHTAEPLDDTETAEALTIDPECDLDALARQLG